MLIHVTEYPKAGNEVTADFEKHVGNREGWPLPNLKRIKDHEFWDALCSGGFKVHAWVSPKEITRGKHDWAYIQVFYTDFMRTACGGVAALYFYGYQRERIEYYSWSPCDHQWSERTVGNCLHEATCKNCGVKYGYDSSD